MAERARAKLQELLSRHSELEQSETKAQLALVTLLSLTQITELKLLLDLSPQGHWFYGLVLSMLVTCISLEILVGVIILYIGNQHYYPATNRNAHCRSRAQMLICVTSCCCCPSSCSRSPTKRINPGSVNNSGYTLGSNRGAGAGEPLMLLSPSSNYHPISSTGGELTHEEEDREPSTLGCCGIPVPVRERGGEVEREFWRLEGLGEADALVELSRIRVAEMNRRIARTFDYVKVLEEAVRKARRGSGHRELEGELYRAREELRVGERDRSEAEAQTKLAEAQRHRAIAIKEQEEDGHEKMTFNKLTNRHHIATYLLYIIMLLNVFITTFGISNGVTILNNYPDQIYLHTQLQYNHPVTSSVARQTAAVAALGDVYSSSATTTAAAVMELTVVRLDNETLINHNNLYYTLNSDD